MDDALSAVDSETEARILENLRGFLKDVTVVLATHRVFVAELCDQVLVLEDGRAIQRGTPQELAALPGSFRPHQAAAKSGAGDPGRSGRLSWAPGREAPGPSLYAPIT